MMYMFIRNIKCVATLAMLALVLSCKKNVVHGTGGIYSDPKSLFSEINDNFNLSHYDTALLYSGLDSVLAGKGPFTAFVVQDDAYPTMGDPTVSGSLSGGISYPTGGGFYGRDNYGNSNFYYQYVQQGDRNYLKKVAGYHILHRNLKIADIPFGLNTGYPTLAEDSVYISKFIDPNSIIPDTVVTVNGIRVIRSDFGASNGTYHVLKQLLFPAPNHNIMDIISGSNALGWAFEPRHNETAAPNNPNQPPAMDTLGFGLPKYNYGLFTTALVRTGLDQLLKSGGPYTLLAVPDLNFFNPYVTSSSNFTPQQIDNMNIDTLTRLMKQHILTGRYFLSDFGAAPFNSNNLVTVYNPAFGTYVYSKPLAFPTIGGDTLYVIPNGEQLNGKSGFWMFGLNNLLNNPYTSLYRNDFAGAGLQDYVKYLEGGGTDYLPQDVIAPNGVIQFLYYHELVPQ